MLDKRQQQIIDYIKEELNQKGYPPSVREICTSVGLKSTSSVHSHLASLEKKGYIKRDFTKPRAIEILDVDNVENNIEDNIIAPYTWIDLGILEGDHLTLSYKSPSSGDIVAFLNDDNIHIDAFSKHKNVIGVIKSVMRKIKIS